MDLCWQSNVSDNFYVGVESSSEGCTTDGDFEDVDRGGNWRQDDGWGRAEQEGPLGNIDT